MHCLDSQKPELFDMFCIYSSAARKEEISRLIQTSRDHRWRRETPFPLSASFTGRQHIVLVCVCEGRRRKLRVKAASVASSSALNSLAHPKPERSFKSEVLGPAAQTPDFTDVSGFYQQLSDHAQELR